MFSLRSLSKGDIPKLLHLILGAGCLNTQGKRREEKRREEKRREEKRREEKRREENEKSSRARVP
jgi:hypothetical protein